MKSNRNIFWFGINSGCKDLWFKIPDFDLGCIGWRDGKEVGAGGIVETSEISDTLEPSGGRGHTEVEDEESEEEETNGTEIIGGISI